MMARTLILSITMGKVDGCRLWSTRLTGGSVYPGYPCPHTHRTLIVQEHRLSIAPRIMEAIPPPNKATKSWIGFSLFKHVHTHMYH